MNELVSSFKRHAGFRGVHVYSEDECKFLAWDEVVAFVSNIPLDSDPEFGNNLLDVLANYSPDNEFLTLYIDSSSLAIQLYCMQQG